MDIELLTALVVAITAFMSSITSLVFQIVKAKKELKKSIPEQIKNQVNYDIDIVNIMDEIKEYLNADRVQIFDFHNGGHYANLRDALKTSCTFETTRFGCCSSSPLVQNLPLSCIPNFISALIKNGEIEAKKIADIKDSMPSVYNLKKTLKINGFYDILLTNKNSEPIGFLAIQYLKNDYSINLEEDKKFIIKKKIEIELKLDMIPKHK